MTGPLQSPPPAPQPAPGLAREIRRWDYVALVLNAIIGAGIFGLPSKVFALVGAWSLLAYVLCAGLIALIIFCFAELASRFKDTGGPDLYTRRAFGPAVGFQVGWLMWLARVTAFASLCNVFLDYLVYFWPAAKSGAARTSVVLALVAAMTAINVIGVRRSTVVINIFTIGKLVALIGFVAAGVFFVEPAVFSFQTAPGYTSMLAAVTMLVFAFSGFEVAVIPAGEGRDPQKHLPFALMTALVIVTLLYILIQFVSIGTLPELATSEKPLADASSRFLGVWGGAFVAVGALVSISGTLNSIMLAGPRLLFAMAEQRQLPGVLAATHARFRTPHVSIVVSGIVIAALTLATTFVSALHISTIVRLLAYGLTCAAVPVLRKREGAAGFVAPAGVLMTVLSVVLSGWLLCSQPWGELGIVAITIAVGLAINFAWAPWRRA